MNNKDYLLRALAIGAYLIAFYFSLMAGSLSYDFLAIIWGASALLFWLVVDSFEQRDHKWRKEDKE